VLRLAAMDPAPERDAARVREPAALLDAESNGEREGGGLRVSAATGLSEIALLRESLADGECERECGGEKESRALAETAGLREAAAERVSGGAADGEALPEGERLPASERLDEALRLAVVDCVNSAALAVARAPVGEPLGEGEREGEPLADAEARAVTEMEGLALTRALKEAAGLPEKVD
jgi:hypothetical protein